MKHFFLLIMLFLITGFHSKAQSVFGKWENTNEDGKINSIIEIYEDGGKVYGKVNRILKEEDRHRVCTKCEGDLKNVPIEGMILMKGLEKDGDEYVGGTIVDPKTGKKYRCKIWLDEDNPDILRIRGYISLFFKTKEWRRAD